MGTAGTVRYVLPDTKTRVKDAREHVYGYLLVTVHPESGKADFDFQELKKDDLQRAVGKTYTKEFIDFCFDQNSEVKTTPAKK